MILVAKYYDKRDNSSMKRKVHYKIQMFINSESTVFVNERWMFLVK